MDKYRRCIKDFINLGEEKSIRYNFSAHTFDSFDVENL